MHYIEKPCAKCGKPMKVAKGKVVKKKLLKGGDLVDPKDGRPGKVVDVQNNDQRAIFHGECRTEGRRELYKRQKMLNKIERQKAVQL